MRFILIAAKQLDFAKTRLAPVLPPGERRELAEAMFRDVLAASLGSTAADHVAVVTSDAGLLAMARAAGALLIDEEFPRGLNVAVALGTSALIAQGARTVCTVLSNPSVYLVLLCTSVTGLVVRWVGSWSGATASHTVIELKTVGLL